VRSDDRRDAVRLAIVWLAIAALLALWLWAARPQGPLIAARDGVVVLPAAHPHAEVVSTWVRWDGPPNEDAWLVLEPGVPWPRGDDSLWRRTLHPGWNRLTWSEAWRLSAATHLRLRLLQGPPGAWGATALRSSDRYGVRDLAGLGGLLAALALAAAVAASRLIVWLARRPALDAWGVDVALVTALAWALRAHELSMQSLWFDEVLTAIGAQDFSWVLYSPQIFGHPPLQYLAGWLMGGRGIDEAALRTPFMLAGVATVPALAWLGRVLLGRAAGLLAALALALCPFHVDLSQTARPYAILLLVAVLALLALFAALRTARADLWIAVTALLAVAAYTHYQGAALALLAAVTALVLLSADGWRGWRCGAVSFAAVGVLLAPWAAVLQRVARVQVGGGDLPALALHRLVVDVFVPQFLGPGRAHVLVLVVGAIAIVSLRRERVRLPVLLAWLGLPLALVWLTQPSHFVAGRHVAFLLVPSLLLFGAGLVAIGSVAARLASALAVIALRCWARHPDERATPWGAAMREALTPGPGPAAPALVAGALVVLALIVAWGGPTVDSLEGYYASRLGFDWRLVAHVLDETIPENAEIVATVGAAYPLRHYWRPGIEVLEPRTYQRRLDERPRGRPLWVVTHEGWDRPPALGEWLESHAIVVAEVPSSWSLPGVRVWRIRGGA